MAVLLARQTECELAIGVLADLERDATPEEVGRAMRAAGVLEAEAGWCQLLMTV
jgi:hypothetical protein